MIPFIWIRTDTSGTEVIVRIADINLEPAAVYSRLVPITGPDEDIRTRGTVRIMLTKVTGTNMIPFIRIRTDTSGTEAIVRIADMNLELAAVYSWLVPIADPDRDIRTPGTVRIMLT